MSLSQRTGHASAIPGDSSRLKQPSSWDESQSEQLHGRELTRGGDSWGSRGSCAVSKGRLSAFLLPSDDGRNVSLGTTASRATTASSNRTSAGKLVYGRSRAQIRRSEHDRYKPVGFCSTGAPMCSGYVLPDSQMTSLCLRAQYSPCTNEQYYDEKRD